MLPKKYSVFWVFVIALFISIVLRLPSLWVHVIDVDEAIWAVCSKMWLQGYIPYIDFLDNKPLGIMAFMALIFKIFGSTNLLFVHAVTIIIVAVTACILFLITKEMSNERAGFFASFLYVVFMTNYIPKVISTNIETLINLPLSISILTLIISYRKNASRNLFFSGLCLAIACCFKYQGGIVGLLVSGAIFLRPPHKGQINGYLISVVKGLSWFFIGTLIPVLFHTSYLYYHGALDAFVLWTLRGSVSYISAGDIVLFNAGRILTRFGTYVLASLPLWILAIAKIISGLQSNRKAQWKEQIVIAWFVLSSIAVFTGWRLYGHYFLLWIPAMSILGGQQLDVLRGRHLISNVIICSIIVITIGFAIPRYNFDLVNRITGEDNPYDYIPIAKAVGQETKQDDHIFVWGYAPSIFYFSDRLPASHFPSSDWLSGRNSLPGKIQNIDPKNFVNKCAWELWREDMERYSPVYIIDASPAKLHDYEFYPMHNYIVLMDYVRRFYEFERKVNGAVFYRRKAY